MNKTQHLHGTRNSEEEHKNNAESILTRSIYIICDLSHSRRYRTYSTGKFFDLVYMETKSKTFQEIRLLTHGKLNKPLDLEQILQ